MKDIFQFLLFLGSVILLLILSEVLSRNKKINKLYDKVGGKRFEQIFGEQQ